MSIGWKPLFGTWFLYALAILLVVARLLRDLDVWLRLAIAAALFAVGFTMSSQGNTSFLHDVLQFYIFFESGASARELCTRIARGMPVWAILALTAAYVGLYVVVEPAGLFASPIPFTLFCVMAPMLVMAVSYRIAPWPIGPGLALLGRRSLEIYLLHFLPAGAMHVIAKRLHLTNYPGLVVLVGTAVAIVFCLIAWTRSSAWDWACCSDCRNCRACRSTPCPAAADDAGAR